MAGSITSVNSVFTLGITGLFSVPQALQGYAADDIFDASPTTPAEVVMGLDGRLTGGFLFVETKMSITMMADSPSVDMFERWNAAQIAIRDLYFANGGVTMPALGKAYTLTRGILTSYTPLSDAKKTLQPRKFEITWQNVQPAAL
jgi:hypothetical protein